MVIVSTSLGVFLVYTAKNVFLVRSRSEVDVIISENNWRWWQTTSSY